MKNRELIITNATGTIAQSIAGIVRRSRWGACMRMIGISPTPWISTPRLFDKIVRQPNTYNESVGLDLSFLRELYTNEYRSLLVPCTDYEAKFLSKLPAGSLKTSVLVSSPAAHEIGCDTYLMYAEFVKYKLPVAQTCLATAYDGKFGDRYVVKPRSGGLSRDIHYGPVELGRFDDSFVVQEFLHEPEITFSFYVNRKGKILGSMAFERTLQYGMTFFCVRRQDLEKRFQNIATNVAQTFGVRGPCNLQGRFRPSGEFAIFEMNCRFSGTCGFRAALGFNDVLFAVDEYLFDGDVRTPKMRQGGGFRRIDEHVVLGVESMEELMARMHADDE